MVRHLLNSSQKTPFIFSIHSITPPLFFKLIITVPRPPSLHLEDPWVAILISSPNLGSLPVDEVKRPDSQSCYSGTPPYDHPVYKITSLLRPYSFEPNVKTIESFYYFEEPLMRPPRYNDQDFMAQRWSH